MDCSKSYYLFNGFNGLQSVGHVRVVTVFFDILYLYFILVH